MYLGNSAGGTGGPQIFAKLEAKPKIKEPFISTCPPQIFSHSTGLQVGISKYTIYVVHC